MVSRHRKKFVFLGVGIFNTLTDFISYSLLMYVLPASNMKLTTVGVVSGTIALCVAFLTHSRITWRGAETGRGIFVRFLLVTGFGMWVVRPILLNIFVHFTLLSDILYKLSYTLAEDMVTRTFIQNSVTFLLMTIVLLIYNFLTYDRFVFSQKNKEKP